MSWRNTVGLHHLSQRQTLGCQHRCDVGEHLSRLPFDIQRLDLAGGRINRDLPGAKQETLDFDRLRVGADGRRCARRVIDQVHAAREREKRQDATLRGRISPLPTFLAFPFPLPPYAFDVRSATARALLRPLP